MTFFDKKWNFAAVCIRLHTVPLESLTFPGSGYAHIQKWLARLTVPDWPWSTECKGALQSVTSGTSSTPHFVSTIPGAPRLI